MSLAVVATAEDARRLTDQIKVAVEGVWHLIEQAYTTRAWSALGHSSWDDYCTREFGTSRLRLPREDRQEVVASLRQSGLSLRAISSATGESEATVRRDLAASGASFDAPDTKTAQVTGIDGKTYTQAVRVVETTTEYIDTTTGEISDRKTAQAPRVNVPRTIQAALSLASDAAIRADRLKAQHFTDKKDEAAIWHCNLVNSIQSLQRLADTLEGASQ